MKFDILGRTVDLEKNKLTYQNKTIKLEPKVMEVLAYFIDHPQELVQKDDIINAVWKDQIVTDHSLKRVISKLRDVFDDDPKQPKLIETITNKGYVFLADISPGIDLNISHEKSHKSNLILSLSILILIMIIILFPESKSNYRLANEKRVTFEKGIELNPFIYADGDSILFIKYNPKQFIFSILKKHRTEANTIEIFSEQSILYSPIYNEVEKKLYFGKIALNSSGIYEMDSKSDTMKLLVPISPHKNFALEMGPDFSTLIFSDQTDNGLVKLFTFDLSTTKISRYTKQTSPSKSESAPKVKDLNHQFYTFSDSKINVLIEMNVNSTPNEVTIFTSDQKFEYDLILPKSVIILDERASFKSVFKIDLENLEQTQIGTLSKDYQNPVYNQGTLFLERWSKIVSLEKLDLRNPSASTPILETSQSNSRFTYRGDEGYFLSNRNGEWHVFQFQNNQITQITNTNLSINDRSELYGFDQQLIVKSQSELYTFDLNDSQLENTKSNVTHFINGNSPKQSYYVQNYNEIVSFESDSLVFQTDSVFNAFIDHNDVLYIKTIPESNEFRSVLTNDQITISQFYTNDTRLFQRHTHGIYFITYSNDVPILNFYDFKRQTTSAIKKLTTDANMINSISVNPAQTELVFSVVKDLESDIVSFEIIND